MIKLLKKLNKNKNKNKKVLYNNNNRKSKLNKRKSNNSRKSKQSRKNKQIRKSKKSKMNKSGGALYGFDLNDNIGGLPARVALTNTSDSDCPSSANYDLGFSNYGVAKGGYYKKKDVAMKKKTSRNKLSKCACSGSVKQ